MDAVTYKVYGVNEHSKVRHFGNMSAICFNDVRHENVHFN